MEKCVRKHFTADTSMTICDTLSSKDNKEDCHSIHTRYQKSIDAVNRENLWNHCLSLTDSISMSAECFGQSGHDEENQRMKILYNIISCFDVSKKEHVIAPKQCLEALQIHVEENENWYVIFTSPLETGLIQVKISKSIPNKIIYLIK